MLQISQIHIVLTSLCFLFLSSISRGLKRTMKTFTSPSQSMWVLQYFIVSLEKEWKEVSETTLQGYSLGKLASLSLRRMENPLQPPPNHRCTSYPIFSPWKSPRILPILDTHRQGCHGSLNQPHKNQKTREPDIAEFIPGGSHFKSCCPSSSPLNSKLVYDVPFFGLKMLQLSTCMVTMATIR